MQLRSLIIAMAAALAAGCVSNESKPQVACAAVQATSTLDTTTEESTAPLEDEQPVFVHLQPFTVNLVTETGYEFLQTSISLEVRDAQAEAAINNWLPKIRSRLTALLSAEKSSELLSQAGKDRLAISLKNEINAIIAAKKGKQVQAATGSPVKSVLFTSFIIQ